MKTLFLVLIVGVLPFLCKAQLKIMDLSVYPAVEMDSQTQLPLDTNNMTYGIDFKVNQISNVSSTNVLIGTGLNSGDILNLQFPIINQGGQFSIQCNGNTYPVNEYSASFRVTLTKIQEQSFQYITLFLVDSQGTETNRLYFKK